MNKKRFLLTTLVIAILAILVFLQMKTWRRFEWDKFALATKDIRISLIIAGIALIYSVYVLRALRWKILLRPVCHAQTRQLLGPTVIGFTGMALLGRPGELIRPFLIARRQKLGMS